MKRLFLYLSFFAGISQSNAQQVRPAHAAEIYHEIAQLKHLTHVLYLAAHPDDENTRLLTYLVRGRHIPTAYLSLTRGDGGQNILGAELGPGLGLIRTYELLEARKLDGAEQFFTRAVDFGFSKNANETFNHWNKELLTGDVVRVMRQYRPDVVICRFPPNAQAGHGQHAASAILAEEAFKVVGNPGKYTGQLAQYPAWQPKRLLFNAYRFGSRNTTTPDMFKLEVGQYSALLGMGYGELAGISRSIHRSQGAGTPSTPGVQTEYFKVVAGAPIHESLFDGIDITWGRVGRPDISVFIDNILKEYDFTQPEKSLSDLLLLRKEIATIDDDFWRDRKLAALDKIILHCAGFMAELYARQPEATPGTELPFTLRIIARAGIPVRLKGINWVNADTALNLRLSKDSLYVFEHSIRIPESTPVTEPYWLSQQSGDRAHYRIPEDSLLGRPTTPNRLMASVALEIGTEHFSVPLPLSFKKLDPTRGDVIEPLLIVPDASLAFSTGAIIAHGDTAMVSVRVQPNKDLKNMRLVLYHNNFSMAVHPLNLTAGRDTIITLVVPVNAVGSEDEMVLHTGLLSAGQELDNMQLNRTQHTIRYEHLPTLQFFTEAKVKLIKASWKATAKRIGYIEGAGDAIDEMLLATGLKVDKLSEADMTPEKLKVYDAIITGIRIVNTERRLPGWMSALMEYTRNGGTLVMQYNTVQDMSTKSFSPYPITLSRSRVTEEDATVTFLMPEHRLLNYPNKITKADFEGWVQERGLYFPGTWDKRYDALFRMNDTGEEPLDGVTLYAPYGKGHFVYTSLAFFRQLPEANTGAIRLLMNMLSVGK